MYDDAKLKEEILNLDKDAIEYFYKEYKNIVLFPAIKSLQSAEEAEDFTHDFLMDFIFGGNGIHKFNPQKHRRLRTFISARLKWRLIDWLRRRRPNDIPYFDDPTNGQAAELAQSDLPSIIKAITRITAQHPPEIEAEANELKSRVQEVIAKLDIDCRRVFLYRYFYDLSQEEIAARLNLPIGTVRSRLYRTCPEKFRKLFGSHFGN